MDINHSIDFLEFNKKFQKNEIYKTTPFRYQLYCFTDNTFLEFTSDYSYVKIFDGNGVSITDLCFQYICGKYCVERWINNGYEYKIVSSMDVDTNKLNFLYFITELHHGL